MIQTRSKNGFTLFELVVVLAILGVVSSIGVGAFFSLTSAWRLSTFRMDLGNTAEEVLDAIKADLARVGSSERTGTAIHGVDLLNEEVRYEFHRLEDDRITIPLVQKGVDGRTERSAVEYHVQREGAPHVLTRTQVSSGASQEVASGVLLFEVEYLADGTWREAWAEKHNPDAVRVSVTVQGLPSRPNEQISRSAVFPIHVK